MAAGRDLALGGSLVMGDQDVRVQAGRNLRAGTVADSGSGNGNSTRRGNNNGNTVAPVAPGASMPAPAQARATARAQAQAPRTAASTQSVGLVSAKGADAASRPHTISARPDLGRARCLQAEAGGELSTTAGARLQSGQAMGIRAGEGVTLAGSALSDTRLSIDAARELRLDGSAGRRHAAIGGQ